MQYTRKPEHPGRVRARAGLQDVDALTGRELDAAVQREVMGSVIGWILMPSGQREPVFVRLHDESDIHLTVRPYWVPRYSTELAEAATLDRRMGVLGLIDLYAPNLSGTDATPEDKCRAALIAVRAARAIQRLNLLAS